MDDLNKICQQYFDKWYSLEGTMCFLQREDKFMEHILKRVSKYDNKFAKMQIDRISIRCDDIIDIIRFES